MAAASRNGQRLELYRQLCRIRLIDERLTQLQRQGRVGFHGSCAGQEVAPVAAGLALRETDWIFPALRESWAMLVRGYPLERYLAQDFACLLDVAKGRQMPSHQSAHAVRVVSWSSCIATQLPQAVGMALAARKLGRDDIALAFLGDGATSHPDFHAALNFAAVFKAPCVFVCQNNQFAISVPVSRQSANDQLFEKAWAYGMPGERVDGNDAELVLDTFRRAAERTRGGEGPSFIECLTYRVGPHSSSDDPARYRDEAVTRQWAERDPIALLRSRLFADGQLDADADAAFTQQLTHELERALDIVAAAPPPPLASLFDDVYARRPRHLDEQALLLASTPRPP
ncbi:MAG TPA: thiamine pyrophosphate-dependent enzyme [Polyangiaceae bacterium]|nr:thiamine pyrophosphate-dependent enzyme [Polyangiaceae bacterium]